MTLRAVGVWTTGALLAMASGCASHSNEEATGKAELGIGSWTGSKFLHTLKVNAGSDKVNNVCTLTIPLTAEKPLIITAAETHGQASSTVSVGWSGEAVTVPGLTVTGCDNYPCDLVATWKSSAKSGAKVTCDLAADDGTTRVAGTSSESAMSVPGAPNTTSTFQQQMDLNEDGISGFCTFRQSDVLPAAEVTSLRVSLNGTTQFTRTSTPVGTVEWPTKVSSIPWGTVHIGTDTDVTKLRHKTPVSGLVEGDEVRCRGGFKDGGAALFNVNVSEATTGSGLTVATSDTAWTCSAGAFGSGDGCDCDCGVMDPDCGTHDCTHIGPITVTSSTNWTINGQSDPALDLVKGRTYVFDNASAHPFAIHTVSGNASTAVRYNAGVTGQGVTNGSLKFTPPLDAPATVHYQCEFHSPMTGALNLLNP